jgi:L-arabinose transport system ATP-binding protein
MADHLQFDSICKTFPGVRALTDVTFSANAGSVQALLGENGAGKSTLLKILSGVYRPDSGRLVIWAIKPYVFKSSAQAIHHGVAVIYQELHLVPEMTVAENLCLGHFPGWLGWVNRSAMIEQAREILRLLGEEISPRARVSSLPIGQRQMVEIAKALVPAKRR